MLSRVRNTSMALAAVIRPQSASLAPLMLCANILHRNGCGKLVAAATVPRASFSCLHTPVRPKGPNRSNFATIAMATTTPTSHPTTATQAYGKTINELIAIDHRCVEKLFACFNAKETVDADRQIAAWKIIKELSIHSCLEEELLYPLLKNKEKVGAQGCEFYTQSQKEHADLKKLLYNLDQIDADPKNNNTMTLMQHIEKATKDHIKEEESEVLPFLAKHYDVDKLKELGKQYFDYKSMMPTRPHPDAPVEIGKYLGDRALHMADALKDKIRFSNVQPAVMDKPCPSAPTSTAHPTAK